MEFTEIKAFKVVADESDKGGEKLIGYFTEEVTAKAAAFKAGWWDSDGEVIPINLFVSPAGNHYAFENVTEQVNKEVDVGAKLNEVVKKLTPEELRFLRQHLPK